MALTFADIFGPAIDVIARQKTAVAAVLTARTAQYAYPSSGSAVSTPEYKVLEDAGSAFYDAEIASHAAIQEVAGSTVLSTWIPFLVRYLKDNDTAYEGTTTELGNALRALLKAMIADDEDLDASAPSAGTVVYDNNNQGGGTATIAINSDTTLAELALAGSVRLVCSNAGFSIQNEERWRLEWVGLDPRTGTETVRRSLSREFRTNTRYYDVVATEYPAAGLCPLAYHQIPQRGGSIHTGLNILVSSPSYNTVTESGDPSTCFANYNFKTIVGTKTNVSRRNCTIGADFNGVLYLRCVDLGGSWTLRVYSDVGLTNPVTEAVTFTEGTGDATIDFITSAPGSNGFSTNGEHVSNGGHLATGSIFMQADIDDSAITAEVADFTVIISGILLPWAVGDIISVPITNAYAGVLSRFFVQEFGFALRVINDGSETIADPA